MKESIKFPAHDEFTMALKSQTGIVAVKDFKFNYNTKVDYFIPEGNVTILLSDNNKVLEGNNQVTILTTKEKLFTIDLFERIINYNEQFKSKNL